MADYFNDYYFSSYFTHIGRSMEVSIKKLLYIFNKKAQ